MLCYEAARSSNMYVILQCNNVKLYSNTLKYFSTEPYPITRCPFTIFNYLFRLCEDDLSNFDPKINETHLQECLKWLMCLYGEEPYTCHMAEFVSMYVLFNLDHWEAMQLALENKSHLM